MPWTTPTLTDTRKMVRDNVVALLRGAAMVPNNVLRVMADAMAGLARLALEYIDWLAKQLLPDTAETEWLDRHGNIWLVNADGTKGRKGATLSSGSILCTGTYGALIPTGSQLSANQTTYETLNQVAIDQDGQAVLNVRALDPGPDGNLDPGVTMAFASSVPDVDAQATVITMSGGTGEEADADLRARVLLRIQNPPMGGDATDYVQWALSVPGVTRAWSFPNEMGVGTVTVRFMMDALRASNNGFPTGDDVAIVQSFMDTMRPVAIKDFWVEAPIPFPINFIISNLDSNDAGTQGNVLVELQNTFMERSRPGQTWYRAWTDVAIGSAAGVNFYDIITPTDDVTMPSPGFMAVIGQIQYQ